MASITNGAVTVSPRVAEKICLASKVVQDRTPEQVIDLAAALGYGGIEWFCLPQHLPADTPVARVTALAARAGDAGIEVVCLSSYAGGFADLSDGECEAQLEVARRYVDLATLLGCSLLRYCPAFSTRS